MDIKLVEEFLDHYSREIDYYSEAARICSERCKSLLNASGIRAIVTYRAKSLERLKEKISKRSSESDYQTIRDIYEDIPDFAGVRIAVYFPQDRDRVGQLINENLEVFKTKEFPDEQSPRKPQMVFKGYVAEHYRARMKEQDLASDQKRYARTGIEIQVASVLMHAWSEVEHDLVYKPSFEAISIREEETLDQLNGLVLSGEIALKQLQDAIKQRNQEEGQSFSNHFELAAYIYDSLKDSGLELGSGVSSMNEVDVLWEFLEYSGMSKPKAIKPYIDKLAQTPHQGSIPRRLIRLIVAGQPSLKEHYLQATRVMAGLILPGLPLSRIIKGSGPALFWYGIDAKRHTFPTEGTLKTWFGEKESWPEPIVIPDNVLARIPIGINVTYKPGTRILKIATDPKKYAVTRGGRLRWLESETIIKAIYGDDWEKLVDVIPNAFFVNYSITNSISHPKDYEPSAERARAVSIDENQLTII